MPRSCNTRRSAPWCGLWLLIAAIDFTATGVRGEALSPQRWLADEKGLVQQQQRWLLPLEVKMQDRVRALPDLQTHLVQSQNRARQVAAATLAAQAQIQAQLATVEVRIQALQQLRGEFQSASRKKQYKAQMQRDTQRRAKLQAVQIPPDQLGGQAAVQTALIDLTNRRNSLAACILWIHDTRPVLRTQYETLAEDREVASALKQLGEGHELGSGKDYDSEPFLRRLAEYEKHVFTDELPLYRAGGELRVAGFINRTPVTFTWHDTSEPTMLTASVIEATGLKIRADASRVDRRMPDGRTLAVRQFEIPYLRFGRHVLTNVPALALPPEGENLGVQIGQAAFEGHSPTAEPERFRLVLR